MWGAIAGIAAASLALAVLHQTLEATGLSEKKPKEQGKLPEPGPGFEKRAGVPGMERGWAATRHPLHLPGSVCRMMNAQQGRRSGGGAMRAWQCPGPLPAACRRQVDGAVVGERNGAGGAEEGEAGAA